MLQNRMLMHTIYYYVLKKGEYQSTPKGRGRGFRYGFPNEEFYLKPQDQMKSLFSDVPHAL